MYKKWVEISIPMQIDLFMAPPPLRVNTMGFYTMETDSSTTGIVSAADTTIATVPTAAHPTTTVPPVVTATVPSTVSASKVPMLLAYC